MSVRTSSWTVLAARLLVSCLFLLSGFHKLGNLDQTASWISSAGLPGAAALALAAAIVEIVGGVSVLLGFGTRASDALLALFLVPTTLVFHDFWSFTGSEQQLQMIQFLKNLAIGGGLLYMVVHGAGALSLDSWLTKQNRFPPWWPRSLSPAS